MKLEFRELKKAVDYITKNGDQGPLNLIIYGLNADKLDLVFSTITGDLITISVYSDERLFSKISKTERF